MSSCSMQSHCQKWCDAPPAVEGGSFCCLLQFERQARRGGAARTYGEASCLLWPPAQRQGRRASQIPLKVVVQTTEPSKEDEGFQAKDSPRGCGKIAVRAPRSFSRCGLLSTVRVRQSET